jgi:hypothetical protein
MTYKEKFLAWMENEKKDNGLISVRAIIDPFTSLDVDKNVDNLTEDIYKGLLHIAENFDSFETTIEVSPNDL